MMPEVSQGKSVRIYANLTATKIGQDSEYISLVSVSRITTSSGLRS